MIPIGHDLLFVSCTATLHLLIFNLCFFVSIFITKFVLYFFLDYFPQILVSVLGSFHKKLGKILFLDSGICYLI